MDLKHIEEMAKDKDIMYAYMVSCFMCYCPDYKDYEYGDRLLLYFKQLVAAETGQKTNQIKQFYEKAKAPNVGKNFSNMGAGTAAPASSEPKFEL